MTREFSSIWSNVYIFSAPESPFPGSPSRVPLFPLPPALRSRFPLCPWLCPWPPGPGPGRAWPFPGAPQLFPFSHSRLHSVPESPFPGEQAQVPLCPPVPTENRLSPTKSDPPKAHLRMKISVSSSDPCPPFRPERPSNPGTKLAAKLAARKHRTRSLHREAAPSRLVQDDGSR